MEKEERAYRRTRIERLVLSKHALKADVKPGGIHLNHIIEQQE